MRLCYPRDVIHLIIDGYNLIRQIPELSQKERISLEAGRQFLIMKLAHYKKVKPHAITVVFDGKSEMSEFASHHKEQGIEIYFSPSGRTADDIIHDLLQNESSRALVVSSDKGVWRHAHKADATAIGAPEFYDRLQMALAFGSPEFKTEIDSPKNRPHKRWTTQKKGPDKRLPKNKRSHSQRIKKL